MCRTEGTKRKPGPVSVGAWGAWRVVDRKENPSEPCFRKNPPGWWQSRRGGPGVAIPSMPLCSLPMPQGSASVPIHVQSYCHHLPFPLSTPNWQAYKAQWKTRCHTLSSQTSLLPHQSSQQLLARPGGPSCCPPSVSPTASVGPGHQPTQSRDQPLLIELRHTLGAP